MVRTAPPWNLGEAEGVYLSNPPGLFPAPALEQEKPYRGASVDRVALPGSFSSPLSY